MDASPTGRAWATSDTSHLGRLAKRSIARILENVLPEGSGWPQYFPQHGNEKPGLCGTCYSVLSLYEASRILGDPISLDTNRSNMVVDTINSKMNAAGGFVVDAHWPVATIDACWESLSVYAAVGVPSDSHRFRTATTYILSAQLQDGGWPYATTLDTSEVFPTTQMLSLLGSVDVPSEMRDACSQAQRRAVDYVVREQAPNGSWASRPAITARAIDALRLADVAPQTVAAGTEWLVGASDGVVSDEFDCIDVRGNLSLALSKERILRYSHTSRALVASALIGAGRVDAAQRLISSIIEDEDRGRWPDLFLRCDLPDGRIGWFSAAYGTSGAEYDPAAAPRYPVWPIYFNLKALADYQAAVNAPLDARLERLNT